MGLRMLQPVHDRFESQTLVINTVLTPLRAKPVQRQRQVMGQ